MEKNKLEKKVVTVRFLWNAVHIDDVDDHVDDDAFYGIDRAPLTQFLFLRQEQEQQFPKKKPDTQR